mgnify:CR=1 FL=1
MLKLPTTAAEAFARMCKLEFSEMTELERQEYWGCESENPLIAYEGDNISVIIDNTVLDFTCVETLTSVMFTLFEGDLQ